MLCTPVFMFTSSSSALLGRLCCGLSIWLSLLAIFKTLFWVYANCFHEKTDKTRKYSSPPFSYDTKRAKHQYWESFNYKCYIYSLLLHNCQGSYWHLHMLLQLMPFILTTAAETVCLDRISKLKLWTKVSEFNVNVCKLYLNLWHYFFVTKALLFCVFVVLLLSLTSFHSFKIFRRKCKFKCLMVSF